MRCWLLLLAACSHVDRGPKYRAAGNALPRDGGTLRISYKDQAATLDPAFEVDEISGYTVHALFDTLVEYAPGSTQIVPGLAESWTISPDQLTYTFRLRDGLVYSDGTPVTSLDVKYSLERARAAADSPFGSYLADVAAITTPNAHVLVIQLSRPYSAFLYVMAMTFTTPQRAEHVAAAGDQMRREPLGTGPFVLDRWDEGERIVLKKNPNYWNAGAIHLDAIEMLENIPRDTQFLMFEAGELDAAERLAPPDYLWVNAQPEWKPFIHQVAIMNAYGSRMNVRVPPFDDRRVRQALNYALDKSHSLKLLQGAAVISHGVLPPGVAGRDDTLAPYPHDPAKARALLAEAGHPDGFDVEYVIMNDSEAERLAGSLQSDLAEVGVRVHITEMSLATFYTATGRKDGPPFSKGAWLGDFPDASDFFDTQFHSRAIADENANNNTFYATPELDALLDAARAEPDPAKRVEMYHRVERILYDDAPWIWDYHQLMTEVTQPYVKAYEPHPVWIRDYTRAWLDLGPGGERVVR
jgi:peptide/nickel transport system substrate-binding protein/oligopeptide transport system substrate-binding protein